MENLDQTGKKSGECQPAIAAGGQPGYSATLSIHGLPFDIPCVFRTVGRVWTSARDRKAVIERLNAACLSVTAYRIPPHQQKAAYTLGPSGRDFQRQPHLMYLLPIVEQQIAECLVDTTVNPGPTQLRWMFLTWGGCWQLMARACVRAILHPVMQEFSEKHSCLAVLPLKYGSIESAEVHQGWIDMAGKILEEASEAQRMGFVLNRLECMVTFWDALPKERRSVGILLTALHMYCNQFQGEARDLLASIVQHLADRTQRN